MLDTLLDKTLVGYTSLGYHVRSLSPIETDLSGRVAVVTGATSGLGRSAATSLAELGAKVVLVGRNPEKAERVRREIARTSRSSEIEIEIADLSLMSEVRALAARLNGPIHLLVNNAGVLVGERTETSEGLETTFATNLLGHFLLTNLLIPTLVQSAPARIINVSSGGMYAQGIRVDDLQMKRGRYDGTVAYARTKRAQVILTEQWAEQLKDQGVVVHAMHPGWADTPGVSDSLPLFHKLTKPLLRTPDEGADTIVWLCAAPEPAEKSGLFWHDRTPRPTVRLERTRTSEAERQALWDRLCELSGWSDSLRAA